ncbi:hypothetical protein NQ318_007410 [Aromia moschata]|uniref:Uncharacterized protein n=1 Tax=Aromia moschata TaxID=1265417 RepID=A0AAV8YKI1_9CUCU|nr:hypothetical protein NQ318_007410 [Aromia moschata]
MGGNRSAWTQEGVSQISAQGARFESVEAVKAKAMEFLNQLTEADFQHCCQQWKSRMERCRDRQGSTLKAKKLLLHLKTMYLAYFVLFQKTIGGNFVSAGFHGHRLMTQCTEYSVLRVTSEESDKVTGVAENIEPLKLCNERARRVKFPLMSYEGLWKLSICGGPRAPTPVAPLCIRPCSARTLTVLLIGYGNVIDGRRCGFQFLPLPYRTNAKRSASLQEGRVNKKEQPVAQGDRMSHSGDSRLSDKEMSEKNSAKRKSPSVSSTPETVSPRVLLCTNQ